MSLRAHRDAPSVQQCLYALIGKCHDVVAAEVLRETGGPEPVSYYVCAAHLEQDTARCAALGRDLVAVSI